MSDSCIHVDEPITPIESEIDLAPTPTEKRYQFRSTVRAWRSKYRRHIGAKQFRKQLDSELKALPKIYLIELATRLKNKKPDDGIPSHLIPVYTERITHFLTLFNISYENDIPTIPPSTRSDGNQTEGDEPSVINHPVLSSDGPSL